MATVTDGLETEIEDQEWKMAFCNTFENKLENVEEVADCIIQGTYMKNTEICDLCYMLVVLFNAPNQFDIHMCVYFIGLLGPSRNMTSFFCQWNFAFVVAALNYMLVKKDFPEISSFCASLPKSSRVIDQMNESPIFKNILIRFIDCDDTRSFSMYCIALVRMAYGKDFISEEERPLVLKAKQKLKNMRKKHNFKEDRLDIEGAEAALYSFDNPKRMTKEQRTKGNAIVKEDYRKRWPAKCCNKNCSKSSRSKAKYCAKCLFPCYCSQKCQKEHWKKHKKECRVLTTIGKNLIPLLDEITQFLKEES